MSNLTFATLRQVNVARCTEGWKHPLEGWTLDDWLIAVGGELGEALNVVKKLNRARDHIIGNSRSVEELKQDLADEIADVVIYLDLTLARFGTTFEQQGGYPTFAELRNFTVAYGEKELPSTIGRRAMVAFRELAEYGRSILLLQRLDELAHAYDIDLGAAVIAKFNRTSERHHMPHRLREAA